MVHTNGYVGGKNEIRGGLLTLMVSVIDMIYNE